MKSSILVCELDSGVLHSAAFPTYAEAVSASVRVRTERTIEVGKKAVPVVCAVVITQNAMQAQVMKMIPVRAEARREALVAEAAKVSKEAKK